MKKLLVTLLATLISMSLLIQFTPQFAEAKVMWGTLELVKGQIGKVTILKNTNLVKYDKKVIYIRTLKANQQFRVYSYKAYKGNTLLGIGSGLYIQKDNRVKYETPSRSMIDQLDNELVYKAKYPKEYILEEKNIDLDKDKKIETIVLTKKGDLFLIKNKDIKKVDSNIRSDEGFKAPKLYTFNPVKGENQIITTYNYFPDNTWVSVYRMKNGELIKILDLVCDIGFKINKTNLEQAFKMYNEDGYNLATNVYLWNPSTEKYEISGTH